MRLRVAWGGGEATTWRGAIHVHGGRIIEKRSLGIEADEPGAMWIDGGRLIIHQKSPRQYDGVDVALVADLHSKLVVVLDPADRPGTSQPVEIDLTQMISDQHVSDLAPAGSKNRLLVRRSPGDRLRIRVLTRSLVFAPGDVMRLQMQPHLLGVAPGTTINIHSQVVRARTDSELSEQDMVITAPPDGEFAPTVPLDFQVPDDEGVYDLVMTATALDARRANPFRNRDQVVAQRRVQFVTLGETPPNAAGADPIPAPNKLVAEINPSQPWWKRVTKLPTLPGFGSGPLQHGDVQPWQHPTLGKLTRLGPSPAKGDATWVAYPLTIDQPGQVHYLEVAYPSNVPQAMGISVVEPNAGGAVLPIGLDSGVLVTEEAFGETPALQRHRIVFWPKTKEPALLITNARNDAPAVHGRIRVLGPKTVGVAALPWTDTASSRLPRNIVGGLPHHGRVFAGYMERPLLPENFSATEAFDPWSQRSMDDWVTFYEAGMRAIEYLQYAGQNGLVISVLAGGSTIYPSDHVEPTPRYDTGVFFSTGQDPIRKDVLEMLFRMCDREGIRLIPALQFSAPLPELEHKLRQGGAERIGIELTDARGITWTQAGGADDLQASYYNPLHPSVQKAMFNVVRELVGRYRHHQSLAGLAIGTSGHGYTLLPGPDWGYDSATISRFADDVLARRLDAVEPRPADLLAQIQTTRRASWLEWRALEMRRFHGRLADELRSAVPNSKLYVTTSAMHASPDVKRMLMPALPARSTPDDLLMGIGIQPKLYVDPNDGIVLVRSRSMATESSTLDRATTLQIDRSVELDRGFAASGKPGWLLQNHPSQLRLTSFDEKSPFGANATHTLIVPHMVPTSVMSRRLITSSLASADTDDILMGGWMLTLGQEESLRDMVTAFRRLPTGQYQTIPGDHRPIVVRALSVGTSTFVYLVNDSPWKCAVTLRTTARDGVAMEGLDGRRSIAAPAQGRWTVELDRYDFVAVRFDQQHVALSDVEVTFDEDVRDLLQQSIHELSDRTVELNRRTVIDVLVDPAFELPAVDRRMRGWTLAGGAGISAELDPRQRHGGAASARLGSIGNVASLISDPFPAPKTGRLSFTVWLKMSPDFQGPLRLAVSGRHEGREIYRFGPVPKTQQWQVFEFHTDDLPLSNLTDMQVRFDLMGPGHVWIDDIEVSDLRFSDNERKELSRILTHAHFALHGGKLDKCARILDGYWPRFLRQHVPLPNRPLANDGRPERQAELPNREPAVEPPNQEIPWWKKTLPGFLK